MLRFPDRLRVQVVAESGHSAADVAVWLDVRWRSQYYYRHLLGLTDGQDGWPRRGPRSTLLSVRRSVTSRWTSRFPSPTATPWPASACSAALVEFRMTIASIA